MSQEAAESRLEVPESVESTIVISRDGRSALHVIYYEYDHPVKDRAAVAMYFTVRLVPRTGKPIACRCVRVLWGSL